MRRVFLALLVAGSLLVSAVPAQARPWNVVSNAAAESIGVEAPASDAVYLADTWGRT